MPVIGADAGLIALRRPAMAIRHQAPPIAKLD
jgi:hypothetical protein